ncbi:MAG: endolytic transglycosylase MltG [Lachnospiraceae bacterium]|nr:endolytic transglycosylase MltG [Lachnospiraceae bacterium]
MKVRHFFVNLAAMLVRILIVLVLVSFIYKLGFKAYDFGYRVFAEEAMSPEPGRDIEVTVPMGSSAMDIGEILENSGLIKDKTLFFVQERLSEYHGKLSPGTYTLNTSQTAQDMMEIMAEEEEASTGEAEDRD